MKGGIKMKKFTSIILTLALAMSVAACANTTAETSATATETAVSETAQATSEAAETEEASQATDDTELADPTEPDSTDEGTAPDPSDPYSYLDTAMEGIVGANYTPILYLGSHQENGTIFSYFCRSQVVSPDAPAAWAVVRVLDDGNGNVTLDSVEFPDYGGIAGGNALTEGTGTQEGAVGAWELTSEMSLGPDATEVFEAANTGYEAVGLLATQIVAGQNYCFLCNDSNGGWAFVIVYFDLQGNSTMAGSASFTA